MTITHEYIHANGLDFHLALAGPNDGPPVILLHGFPEHWGGWAAHMPRLAELGYRVIAPDLRGYGKSSKPGKVADYALDLLVDDVVSILRELGHPQAHVVGHDWGGALAWQVARQASDHVQSLVVINCPPVDVMQRHASRSPKQLLKSWYIMFFQSPLLPQWACRVGNFRAIEKIMTDSALSGTFTHEGLAGHRAAWAEPNALRSMIHWYRAGLRYPPTARQNIDKRALLLWGEGDKFLGTDLIPHIEEVCDNLTVQRYPDNTHWLPHEAPDEVVAQLHTFFLSPAPPKGGTLSLPSNSNE